MVNWTPILWALACESGDNGEICQQWTLQAVLQLFGWQLVRLRPIQRASQGSDGTQRAYCGCSRYTPPHTSRLHKWSQLLQLSSGQPIMTLLPACRWTRAFACGNPRTSVVFARWRSPMALRFCAVFSSPATTTWSSSVTVGARSESSTFPPGFFWKTVAKWAGAFSLSRRTPMGKSYGQVGQAFRMRHEYANSIHRRNNSSVQLCRIVIFKEPLVLNWIVDILKTKRTVSWS